MLAASAGSDGDGAFSVFDAVQLGEDWVQYVDHRVMAGSIAAFYPAVATESLPGRIDVAPSSAFFPEDVLHEFGHVLSFAFNIDKPPTKVFANHYPGVNMSAPATGLSWSQAQLAAWEEGFADYFAVASTYELKGNHLYIPNRPDLGGTIYTYPGRSAFDLLSAVSGGVNPDAQGDDDEGAVARALWAMTEESLGPFGYANRSMSILVTKLATQSTPVKSFSDALSDLNKSAGSNGYALGGSASAKQVENASNIGCEVLHPNGIDPDVLSPKPLQDLVPALDGTPPMFSWFPSGPDGSHAGVIRLDTFHVYVYDTSWKPIAQEDNATPSAGSTATLVKWQPDPSGDFWKKVLAFTTAGARPTTMHLLVGGEAKTHGAPSTGPYPSCDHPTGPVVPTVSVSGSPTPLDSLCQSFGSQSPTDNQFRASGAGFIPGQGYTFTIAGTYGGYALPPISLTPSTVTADAKGLIPSTLFKIPAMPAGIWAPVTKVDSNGNTVVTTPGGLTATPATAQDKRQTAMSALVTHGISCDQFAASSATVQTRADAVGLKPKSTVSVVWTDTTTSAVANKTTVTADVQGNMATGNYAWSCTPGHGYQASLQGATLRGPFTRDYRTGSFVC